MLKKSQWTINPDRPLEGYATFFLDGVRFDYHLDADGMFVIDGGKATVRLVSNAANPAYLAEKLEELAATFKDAARQERSRLVGGAK